MLWGFVFVACIAHMFTTDGSVLQLSDIFLIIVGIYEILKEFARKYSLLRPGESEHLHCHQQTPKSMT